MKPVIVASALPLLLCVACNSSQSTTPPGAPTSVIVVPTAQSSVTREPATQDEPAAATPSPGAPSATAEEPPHFALHRDGGVGCGAFDPIKSQDACSTASDCAPSAPCHAPSCVAASKAPPRTAGVQCTMKLVCRSLDVGRCDCVDGLCSLVSR